jgi:hypothetical protein
VLLSRTHQHTWTRTEISTTFALNLLSERTPALWYASKNNNGNEDLSKRKSYERSATISNAFVSGSASSSGVELLRKAKMLSDRNVHNKATEIIVPCRHCGKPWKHSYTCDEYRNTKRQKSASVVLSVSTSSDIKEENASGQLSQTMKELYESETYPCKSKMTNKSD